MRKVICVKCNITFETERKNGTHCVDCIQARNEGRAERKTRRCTRCGDVIPQRVGRPARFCSSCRVRETQKCALCGAECHPHGLRQVPYCDACVSDRAREVIRDRDLRRMYGLTLAEHTAMLARQSGECACCGGEMDPVHVDHCHVTGRVRGLLCMSCNTGIGLLGDSLEGVRRAVTYLERVDDIPARGELLK